MQAAVSSSDPYGLFKFMAKKQQETVPKIEEELRMLKQEALMKASNPSENPYLRRSYLNPSGEAAAAHPIVDIADWGVDSERSTAASLHGPVDLHREEEEAARLLEKHRRKYGKFAKDDREGRASIQGKSHRPLGQPASSLVT